jgi:hypothetical protein
MKIGLLDVDGHNFPNLALMKISSFYKENGHSVEFVTMFDDYDIIYKSKVFTFTPDNEYCYRSDNIIKGGTGYDIKKKLPDEIDCMFPDYSLYDCEHAYGFLTRGCTNKCSWCVVPEKEGDIKPYADIKDFIGGYNSAVLLDNNVLASEHGIKQIEKIINLKIKVDFNQGLDARLIDDKTAKLLSRVKWLKPLRMACDSKSQVPHIEKAITLLRKYNCTPKNYFIYVLVKEIEDALDRVMFLDYLKVDPFCQPYRDFTTNKEPERILKQFSRWVNHKAVFRSCTWQEYRRMHAVQ